jgi:hypothetical protein
MVARSISRPVGVVPLGVAMGATVPASLRVPAKLRRQVGGSTARRSVRARSSVLVTRVALQIRAGRPEAGSMAVSHPLTTSGSVDGRPAAELAVAAAWACARSAELIKMSARRDCSLGLAGW